MCKIPVISVSGLAIALLAACSCSGPAKTEARTENPRPIMVAVARAAHADLSRDLVLSAEFRPYQEVDVYAKVAGYVKHINVDIGDRVKKDQILATLEIPEMTFDLEHARAEKQRSEAELIRARDDLERLQSAHQAAHLSYTRLASVVKLRPNLVAQQEIDDALARDRVSEAQVAAAKAALAAAEQQVRVSAATERKMETLNAYSRITAPISGVITKRWVDTGEMVQAGTASHTQANPVVTIAQNDRLRLVLPVPESVVPRVRIGEPVEVRVESLVQSFKGTVARFSGKVDASTRTMETEVDVLNPKLVLVPGMYAEAALTLERRGDALAIPVQAVSAHDGSHFVFLVNKEHKIEQRSVRLGVETPAKVEVLSGLQENDLVVVGSRSQLRPGQLVEPKIVNTGELKEER